MKNRFAYLFLFFLFLLFSSCKNDRPQSAKTVEKAQMLPENLKKVEVMIGGMTCEIGCARMIESKLSKANGIKFVDVSFQDSIAKIEFDSSVLSQKAITGIIENVAGGGIYKVKNIEEVSDFRIKN